MHAIGLSSYVYLFYLLVLLPIAAIRSARRFNAPPPKEGEPPRRPLPPYFVLMLNTLLTLGILFALAWFTARTFEYKIFALPHFGSREILAGLAAFGVLIVLVFVSRAIRTPEERRNMPIRRLMPVTPRDHAIHAAVAIAAGISEEAAYRGVLMSILWYGLGNPWIAVLMSSLAFSVVHALQGWKSAAIIFVIALAMHALVWFTQTLVIAMFVHAAYDLAAPAIRKRLNDQLPP